MTKFYHSMFIGGGGVSNTMEKRKKEKVQSKTFCLKLIKETTTSGLNPCMGVSVWYNTGGITGLNHKL